MASLRKIFLEGCREKEEQEKHFQVSFCGFPISFYWYVLLLFFFSVDSWIMFVDWE